MKNRWFRGSNVIIEGTIEEISLNPRESSCCDYKTKMRDINEEYNDLWHQKHQTIQQEWDKSPAVRHNLDDVVMNRKKSTITRIMFDVSRLERNWASFARQIALSVRRSLTTLSVTSDKKERWDLGR